MPEQTSDAIGPSGAPAGSRNGPSDNSRSDTARSDTAQSDTERLLALTGYGLFLLAVCNGVTALIGVALAYIRRDEARGTMWESHYRNMITVFWVVLLLGLLMFALAISGALTALELAVWPWNGGWIFSLPLLGAAVPLAVLAWLVSGIWYLYRILRGFIRALDDKPY